MQTMLIPTSSLTPRRVTLVAAYRAAVAAHGRTLARGTAREILTAFRAALDAEVAILRHDARPDGLALADGLEAELDALDTELASLATGHPGGVQ